MTSKSYYLPSDNVQFLPKAIPVPQKEKCSAREKFVAPLLCLENVIYGKIEFLSMCASRKHANWNGATPYLQRVIYCSASRENQPYFLQCSHKVALKKYFYVQESAIWNGTQSQRPAVQDPHWWRRDRISQTRSCISKKRAAKLSTHHRWPCGATCRDRAL